MLGFLRKSKGFVPLRARRGQPEAVEDALRTINNVFARWADVPLHLHVQRVAVGGTNREKIQVDWADVDGRCVGTTIIDHAQGEIERHSREVLRQATLRHAAMALRRRALLAHGWPAMAAEPTWTLLIHETHMALLASIDVHPRNFDAGMITDRIAKATRYRNGAIADLKLHDALLIGMVETIGGYGEGPGARLRSHPHTITIRDQDLPDTALAALVGRPLDDLVKIGPGCPGTTIVSAQSVARGDLTDLKLDLAGKVRAFGDVPEGFDRRWETVRMETTQAGEAP